MRIVELLHALLLRLKIPYLLLFWIIIMYILRSIPTYTHIHILVYTIIRPQKGYCVYDRTALRWCGDKPLGIESDLGLCTVQSQKG